MTRGANHEPEPSRPPEPDWRDHQSRAFASARRHSRLVRVLRLALPAFALLIGAAYFVSSRLQVQIGDFRASVGHVEVRRDALRMVNPKIEGNKTTGDYVVTADFAEQNVDTPSIIDLNEVRAEMTDARDGWSRLSAPKGTFDSKAENLALFGGIKVASSSGMVGNLATATVDMKSQLVTSEDPVAFEFLNGTVNALTMEIAMDKRIVTFNGDVRVHVRKRPAGDDQPASNEKVVKAE